MRATDIASSAVALRWSSHVHWSAREGSLAGERDNECNNRIWDLGVAKMFVYRK